MDAAFRPDWLAKTLAGVLLGLALGLVCSWLFMQLAPDARGGADPSMKHTVATYVLLLVWALAMGLVFLFRSGARAWLWLAAANLVAGALLALVLVV